MVHLEMMAALLDALPAGARLVLLGDKDQLASVEAGAVLGDLCRDAEAGRYDADTARYALAVAAQALLAARTATPGAADAGIIWRAAPDQASPATVLALAVQGREQAPASYADYLTLVQQGPSAFAAPARAGLPTGQLALDFGAPDADGTPSPGSQSSSPVGAAVNAQGGNDDPHTAWVKAVLRAFDRFRILCAVHDGPWGDRALNQGVQRALAQAGLLQPAGEWFVGRPVMVTRNDAALGVFNGDVGVVLPSARSGTGRADGAGGSASAGGSGGALRAWFLDGDALRSVSVSRLAHVDTAFAMTVHKSQGSEFAHTVLVMAPGAGGVMTRELVYTGITRARTHFSLVEGEPGLLATAIRQRVVRASGLQARLGL